MSSLLPHRFLFRQSLAKADQGWHPSGRLADEELEEKLATTVGELLEELDRTLVAA